MAASAVNPTEPVKDLQAINAFLKDTKGGTDTSGRRLILITDSNNKQILEYKKLNFFERLTGWAQGNTNFKEVIKFVEKNKLAEDTTLGTGLTNVAQRYNKKCFFNKNKIDDAQIKKIAAQELVSLSNQYIPLEKSTNYLRRNSIEQRFLEIYKNFKDDINTVIRPAEAPKINLILLTKTLESINPGENISNFIPSAIKLITSRAEIVPGAPPIIKHSLEEPAINDLLRPVKELPPQAKSTKNEDEEDFGGGKLDGKPLYVPPSPKASEAPKDVNKK